MAETLISVSNTLVSGTSSADTISTRYFDLTDVTIEAGAGNDFINNRAENALIDAGAGKDTIYNHYTTEFDITDQPTNIGGKYSTLKGGAGADSIKNTADSVLIDGGADNDYIDNDGDDVTLNGGAGNDTIKVGTKYRLLQEYGNVIEYAAGGGNDILLNYNENDTIRLIACSISGGYTGVGGEADDLILQIGDGTLTIKKGAGKTITVIDAEGEEISKVFGPMTVNNADDDTEITTEEFNDYISNSGERVTINADGGADYIFNSADDVSIDAGSGKDTVENRGERVTINGGIDDDHIDNYGSSAKINGGAGNDVISSSGERASLTGGAGNDTINVGAASRIIYGSGDGNDVIVGYDETSTLQLTSGSVSGSSVDGLDVILQVGSGTITIKDGLGKSIKTLVNGKLTTMRGGSFDQTNEADGVTLNGNSSGNKLSNSGSNVIINGLGGNDTIFNEGANVSISGGAGNDLINDQSWGSTTVNGGLGNDTITFANDAGHVIEFGSGDGRDVVIGYGASDSIKITSGTLGEPEFNGTDAVFNIGSGTLTIKDGFGKRITFIDADDQLISSELYGPARINNFINARTLTGTGYNDTISNSGANVTINSAAGNDSIVNSGEEVLIDAGAGTDAIINSGQKATVRGGADNDAINNSGSNTSIDGGAGDDYIANAGHNVTLKGGAGNDVFDGSDDHGELYVFNAADGNDIINNFYSNDTISIGSGSSIVAHSSVEGDYVLTVKSASSTGTITLKDVGDKRFTVKGSSFVYRSAAADEFYVDLYNDTDRTVVSLDRDERYYVTNTGEYVTIKSGSKDDTMEGSDLYGEVFDLSAGAGNDSIVNFAVNDSLHFSYGSVTDTLVSGNDYLITLSGLRGTSAITLQNAGKLTFAKSSNGQWMTAVSENTIDNNKNNTQVGGTDGADLIFNSGSKVTIRGNGSNDTIEGSNNPDVYLFGAIDGNDIIYNFSNDDTLKIIQGNIESAAFEGNDYVVNVKSGGYSGSVILKDVAGKKFRVDDRKGLITGDAVNYLVNRDPNVLFAGTDGKDYMTNSGENVTIQPNGGDDTITGSDEYGDRFLFAPADGNNVITNFGKGRDTLQANSGTISTLKSGSDVLVSIKSGSDIATVTLLDVDSTLLKKSGNSIIWDGVNTLRNSESNVLFYGTEGRDSMINSGENVTIVGSAGNDTFMGSTHAELYRIASNHGNNVITNFGTGDSLQMSAGQTMTYAQSGSHVVVTLKGASYTGKVTLRNVSADKLTKLNNNTIVYGSVNTIPNSQNNTVVSGTDGKDLIINSGSNVTIMPGGNNDTIEAGNGPEWFNFSSADGNNLIRNFGVGDSIKMTAGKTITFETVGSDVIVTLKGASYTGIETLEGAAGQKLVKSGTNVLYSKQTEPIVNRTNFVKFAGTSDADSMISTGYGVTIDPKAGDDTITASDAYGDLFLFNADGGKNIITNFGKNDSIRITSGTINSTSKSGDDFIVNLKSSTRTGSITLQGAGNYNFAKSGNTLLTVLDDVTIENSRDNTLVAGGDADEYIINYGQFVTLEGKGGSDTLEGSNYGEVFAFSSADGDNVVTNFGANDTLRCTAGSINAFATVGSDIVVTIKGSKYEGVETLLGAAEHGLGLKKSGSYLFFDGVTNKLNRSNNVKVNGTDGRDNIINTGNNVTINGGRNDDTITGSDAYGEVFQFSSADGNDVITNFSKNDTLQITAGRIDAHYREGDDYVVNVKSGAYAGSITLKDAGNLIFIEEGNRLTVDQVNYIINRKDGVKVAGTDGRDYIVNSGEHVTIQPNGGNDTLEGSEFGELFNFSSADGRNVITNFGANDTLRMTAGKTISFATVGADVVVTLKGTSYTGIETLLGAAGLPFKKSGTNLIVDVPTNKVNTNDNVIFSGSSGKDYMVNSGEHVTISSGAGNDTVVGSNYAELFQFASNTGNNVVTNFGVNDTLQCTAGSIQGWSKSGSSTIVTLKGATYTGKVTLRNTSGYVFKKSGAYLTVDAVNNISNSDDKKLIVGTDGRDYIVNSGQNVTIQAGPGADTIEGSVFGELFDFSSADGNNVITNFGANDTLRMTAGKTLSFATVGADVVVTLKGTSYTGIETLQGAAGLNFQKSGTSLRVSGVNPILNTTNNKKVTGTSGADYIISTGNNVTVEGKGGNDTITGSEVYGELFNFSSADGHNVITNFGTNDTLTMTAGKTISYAVDDNDYVITLKGASYTGTVRLIDAVSVGTLRKSGKSVMLWSNDSSAQLAAETEDYWFEQSDQPVDEINSILSIENNSVDFELDPIEQFKANAIDLAQSARSEKLKK